MDDGTGELVGGGVSAQIFGADLAGLQDVVNGTVDLQAVVLQINVTKHLRGAQEHRRWIGDVLTDSFGESVTCTLEMRI